MRWPTWIIVFMLPCTGVSPAQLPPSEVQTLFRELQDRKTTDKATDRLEELAKRDMSSRQYVAGHLPALIQKTSMGPIWLNAVRLAGELKVTEAVPVLVVSLEQDNVGGSTTFAETQRLDNDAAGKALVKIGDPAIQAVAQVLESGDRNARWRAALVLLNINSPTARQVLHRHIPKESDSGLQDFIRSKVG